MNITLIGFMGTGKSTVGKRLAKRLSWRFIDVDSLIEATAKKPVPRIFMEHGEPVFRRLEQRVIRRVSRDDKQVIATGGGAFLEPANRTRLRMTGPVICLTAKPQAIVSRLQRQLPTRPLLSGAGSPLAKIKLLLNRRARAYAQADLTVDTTAMSVDQVVERVWSALAPCLCKSWQYLLRNSGDLTKRYAGKYIVVVDERIIASGDSQLEAYQNAPRLHEKRDAGIYYVPRPEESLTAF